MTETTEQDVRTVSAEQVAAERWERREAVIEAQKILGTDAGIEDILVLADWIWTGRADLAVQFAERNARLYGDDSTDGPAGG